MTKANPRVLVVDDDPRIRELIADGLSQVEYECVEAESGEDASRALAEQEFELVLLDINMPGMSGMDLLPRIRAAYPDVAVIMLTGSDELATAVWAMREGASDYATKPVTLAEVIIRVENALSRRALVLENRDYQRRLDAEDDEQ